MTESELFRIWISLYSKKDSEFVTNWWLSLDDRVRQALLDVMFATMGGKS